MHRPNTDEELRGMLGDSIADAYCTVQHDAFDEESLVSLGRTHFCHETAANRAYMETAVSILSGFIEPHFLAGFSGGPEAVNPGLAGASLVPENHSVPMLDAPGATWGVTAGNPLWEEMNGSVGGPPTGGQ